MASPRTLPRVRLPGLAMLGDVPALWVLVGLELVAQVFLRHYYRRHHGG